MHQAGYRPDAQFPETVQPRICPVPVEDAPLALHHFPQDGISKRAYAKARDPIEIIDAIEVACLTQLIAHRIADADMAAFHATPHLQFIAHSAASA